MNQQSFDIRWQEQNNMAYYKGEVCGLFGKVETYYPGFPCGGCNPKQKAVDKLPLGIEVDMCVCVGNCGGSYYFLRVGIIIGIVIFIVLLFYVFKFIFGFSKKLK